MGKKSKKKLSVLQQIRAELCTWFELDRQSDIDDIQHEYEKTKKNRTYFVYKYTFPLADKYYIGRTFEGSGRFGNVDGYKNQAVYDYMIAEPDFVKEKVFKSTNIFEVYYMEHCLINEDYTHTVNMATETRWFDNACRDFLYFHTPGEFKTQLDEFAQNHPSIFIYLF